MLGMSSGGGGDSGRGLRFQLSEKLIQVSLPDAGIRESSLAWGKLPRMERNEVLAGAGGRSSRTASRSTGRSTRSPAGSRGEAARAVHARCYVLPEADRTGEHGDEGNFELSGTQLLIPMDAWQLAKRETNEQLQRAVSRQ